MAGVLLSGWRIRLFDSAGNPLTYGKVEFFDATTSLPKTIYSDKDLTIALGTSVTTDLEGYLPAIWLSDGYYKGIVSERIQADPETWKPLWTINHLGKELVSSGTPGSGTMAYCENIAELKAITAGTIDAAIVAGYYNAGDVGEPMFFTWNGSSTKTDDAGAYIRSNDTPSGTAGRYHQIFSGTLDIRKWGGLPDQESIDCTGALINMGNYAADNTIYPVYPPVIGFIAQGVYHFSGNVSLNRIWTNSGNTITHKIPYYLGNGARIDAASNIVTFTNPITIESDTKIGEYPTSYVFEAGSVEFLRPQWMPDRHGNLVHKISAALNRNFPVKVYGLGTEGEVEVDEDVEWNQNNSIYFESSTIYFTGSYKLTISSPIYIPNNQYIFRCPTSIVNNEINAKWFGWGYLSGNNQGPALQAAINASKSQESILVPALTNSNHIIDSSVSGYSSKREHALRIEGVITLGSSGSISDVYLDVPYNKYCISATESNFIHIMNPTISPMWFGARPVGFIDSIHAIQIAFMAAARGKNTVDGCGYTYYVGSAILTDLTGISKALVSIKNITINPRAGYNTTTDPVLMAIMGIGDCELESVNLNTDNVVVKSLTIDTSWCRINKCSFYGDVHIGSSCEDYVFTNNQVYNEVDGTEFTSAQFGAIITGNTFTQCRIHLIGDAGIQTGYYFPMLQNMIVSNNVFQNTDGSHYKGCVYIISNAPNTLVNGLNITNNVFSGNIPELVTNPDENFRYRILSVLWNGGSFATAHQSGNDVRHLIVIKDNTYQWYDPYRSVNGSMTGHRQNYLPSTSGFETGLLRTLTSTTKNNDLFRDSFSFLPDPTKVFQLAGDTASEFSCAYFTITGWRKKTGTNTWDSLAPCEANISQLGMKANTSGTLSIDVDKYQYNGTAGSSGWSDSTVHYGWTWKIYEDK